MARARKSPKLALVASAPDSSADVLARALGDHGIGREARAQHDDHAAVKLWLRLLACSTQIEQQIRTRLRERFATTLPRFDYLAQLERHPQGLRMNALSRYLMVTGGNVTGLTDQLQADRQTRRAAPAGHGQGGVPGEVHRVGVGIPGPADGAGRLAVGAEAMVPCTPLGCLMLLRDSASKLPLSEEQLKRRFLRSAFDGVVVDQYLHPGALVDAAKKAGFAEYVGVGR